MRKYLIAVALAVAGAPASGQDKAPEKPGKVPETLDDTYAPAAIGRAVRGDWKSIKWETDPRKAVEKAQKGGKPLLVFLHLKGHNAEDPNPEAC